jgi:hypothetical protein
MAPAKDECTITGTRRAREEMVVRKNPRRAASQAFYGSPRNPLVYHPSARDKSFYI